MQSVTATSHASTRTTTKRFMSMSSQSIIDSGKGKSLAEKIETNGFLLSLNLHRYKFSSVASNIAAGIHMIQYYCLFLMPSCNVFWQLSEEGSIFQTLLRTPMHFCFTTSEVYHLVIVGVFTVFWIFSLLFALISVIPDPEMHSSSNARISVLRVIFEVLTPCLAFSTLSAMGVFLRHIIFEGARDYVNILGVSIGVLCIGLCAIGFWLHFYLIQSQAKIQYDKLFVPWGANVTGVLIIEYAMAVLAMLQDALPLGETYARIGYSVVAIMIANPGSAIIVAKSSLFQDPADTSHHATMLFIGFISTILVNVGIVTTGTSPTLLIVIIAVLYVIVTIVFQKVKAKREGKLLKRLYSVYKKSKGVLPHITPLIFAAPMSNQVALSQEAYQVMQAFGSLEITTAVEFRKVLAVGAKARMPAMANTDFIKWGLNYFTDDATVLMCAQLCQHFGEHSQTQSVILQKLRESTRIGLFMRLILASLEHDHTDAISSKPLYMKALDKKASGGVTRCKRSMAVFWGSILNHSEVGMRDAMCAVRGAIADTEEHFDELMRCYPMAPEAISLYLSYLTEVKGEFIECNEYINLMSAKFIEKKAEQLEEDEAPDEMSVLLADEKRPFAPFVKSLGSYMEQQRHLIVPMNKPLRVLLGLTMISLLVILSCLVYSIASTLSELQKFPKLVKMISSFIGMVSDLARLMLAERRLCLFAHGLITDDCKFSDGCGDDDPLFSVDTTMAYIKDIAEEIGEKFKTLYLATTFNDNVLRSFRTIKTDMSLYGLETSVTLSYGMETIALQLREIAGNVPKLFDDPMYNTAFLTEDSVDYAQYKAICSSDEMKNCVNNIFPIVHLANQFTWIYYDTAYEQVMALDVLLYWSMIAFPVAFLVIFGISVVVVASYIHRECQLRMTLYLSLPEQVASEIFRAGGGSNNKGKKGSTTKADTFTTNMLRANEEAQEKAMAVETLYQVVGDNSMNGTGLSTYAFWMIVYIILGAATIFGLSLLARSVNSTFISRIMAETYAYLRTGMYEFLTVLIQELFFFFHGNMIDMGTNGSEAYASYLLLVADQLFEIAQSVHSGLTFGGWNISIDFREYQAVQDVSIRSAKIDSTTLDWTKQYTSAVGLVHDGYAELPIQSVFEVYNRVVKYILEIFRVNLADKIKGDKSWNDFYFKVGDQSWDEFSHLALYHLYRDLGNISSLYTAGGGAVIQEGFTLSLVISVGSLLIVLVILIGPMFRAYRAIRGYITMQMLVMGHVPPKVFHRSMYIQKWLKGDVTRSNFRSKTIEPFYRRMVSATLQNKLLSESPEKLILFTSQGVFKSGGTLIPADIDNPSLEDALGYIFDTVANKGILESIQQAMERFGEAKDTRDQLTLTVNSLSGSPLKLTVTGITSDTSVSSSVQRFYSHVAILVRDITKEAHDEGQYAIQKERTLGLLVQFIPGSFARRLHDGERRISFTSGIGSVLTVSIMDYDTMFSKLDQSEVAGAAVCLRTALGASLSSFPNMSKVYLKGGTAIFVAGLFNDEQNGRTEAIDTLTFIGSLHQALLDTFEKYQITSELRYGVATGGPIFCHVMMDVSPIIIVTGDVVSISNGMFLKCPAQTVFLDRTTYECIYGLNIEAQMAGETDYNGRKISYYSVPVQQVMRLSAGQQQAT